MNKVRRTTRARWPRGPVLILLLFLSCGAREWVARVDPAGIPASVHARGVDGEGQAYSPAEADPGQRPAPVSAGTSLHALAPAFSHAAYYPTYARSPSWPEPVRRPVTVLDRHGRRAPPPSVPGGAERLLAWDTAEHGAPPRSPIVGEAGSSPVLASTFTPDPAVAEMIARVEGSTVYTYTGGLSGEWPVIIGGAPYTISTRYSRTTTPIEKATQYVYEHLGSLGLAVEYHSYFLAGTGIRRNVIAEQPGSTDPVRVVLLTAHLDDTSGDPYNVAPGADDNASGSAGVLIAADILSQYAFGCTLRYALFTGEEQGMHGSAAYAQEAYLGGDGIEAVLNLDMIGYNSDAWPTVELHTRQGNADDLAIANLFADVVSAYDIDLIPEVSQDGMRVSDHASFWDYGYPGVLGIEDLQDSTPFYHTTGDRIHTLDLSYHTNFVKAAVGTIAHLGCLPDALQVGFVSSSPDWLGQETVFANTTMGDAPITYTWDLDDGSPLSTEVSPTHTYSAPGTYTVVLTATDGEQADAAEGAVTVYGLPVAGFSPLRPFWVGGTAVFSNTTQGNPRGDPAIQYEWAFGDGDPGSTAIHATHVYSTPGTYTVALTATNPAGSATKQDTVCVYLAGVSMSPADLTLAGRTGTSVTCTLWVTNSGTYTDSYVVSAGGHAWATTAVPETLLGLGPGDSSSVRIEVAVPRTAPVGERDTVRVTVTSQGDGSTSASSVLTTTADGWRAYLPLVVSHPWGAALRGLARRPDL